LLGKSSPRGSAWQRRLSAIVLWGTSEGVTRELRGAVVVVTGASSGIGRATALTLAREGARLALGSRGEQALCEVARECGELGAETVAVVIDVREEESLARLAAQAVERFGRIDVWVNSAGVIAYGPFEDLPADVFRGVIETNFLGQVNGARVALPRFREQGAGADQPRVGVGAAHVAVRQRVRREQVRGARLRRLPAPRARR
jgi:NAD(P)-dependent dehydrogenase (short-subunit alcohol dehydrogenase family)